MTAQLICVTGPDGAGKTTQITRLAAALERDGYKVAAATVWDVMLDPSTRSRFAFRDPTELQRYLEANHPTSRGLFIFHMLHEALQLARKRDADVILFDAYWYKYFATEVAHGGDRKFLRSLADSLFPRPALTFHLRVDPEEAFARKRVVSAYECGYAEPRTKEAFVAFQSVAQFVYPLHEDPSFR